MRREDAEEYAEWFRSLADATRVQLLAWLARRDEPMPVKEIVAAFPLSQSTVSHHLSALTRTCFVVAERRGTSTYYSVNPACMTALPGAAAAIMNGPVVTCCAPPTSSADTSSAARSSASRSSAATRSAATRSAATTSLVAAAHPDREAP